MADETCAVSRFRGFRSVACGKPAKGRGTRWESEGEIPMCGIHLAGLRRRNESSAAWQRKWDEDRAIQGRVSGLHRDAMYINGRVSIPLAVFEELMKVRNG